VLRVLPTSPVCLVQRLRKKKNTSTVPLPASQGAVAALRTALDVGGLTSPSSMSCTAVRQVYGDTGEAWLVNVQCQPVLQLR
jgi:hypothetical protein